MKKIISIALLSLTIIAVWAGCQETQDSNDKTTSEYECPTDNTLNCVGSGAPGSLCNDIEFIDWAKNNCPNFQILE